MNILEEIEKEIKFDKKLRSLNYVNKYEGKWFFEIGKFFRTNLQTSYKKDFKIEEENKKINMSIIRTINYIEYQEMLVKDFFQDFIDNYMYFNKDKDIKINEVVMLFEVINKTILNKFFDNIDFENCYLLEDFFNSEDYEEEDLAKFDVRKELEEHIKIRNMRIKEKVLEYPL